MRLPRLEMGENARMALNTLRTHKVRSALSVVGVVIGITAVIAVSSILVGVQKDVSDVLEDFGTDTLFVFKFQPGFHGRLTPEERMRKPLSLEDGLAIEADAPAVKEVSIEVFPRVGTRRPPSSARFGPNEVIPVEFTGATPSYERVLNAQIADGRFFTESENMHASPVIVIGWDVAEALFPGNDAVGKTVLVNGVPYEVVGVQARRKGKFLRADGGDRQVVIPYRTYKKHYPADDEHFLAVQAYPGMKAAAEDQVRGILRQRRRVAFNDKDNFGISSAEQIAQQFRQITGAVFLVTVVIASIGLLVGGVGVMNIMLMSVTERTREIGVRKAIGAKRRDIIAQFLTEAVTITGAGGIIGTLLGGGISLLINLALPSLPSYVPMWAVMAAVGVSTSIGLFFGMYPAVKAARLDPVDALRYE